MPLKSMKYGFVLVFGRNARFWRQYLCSYYKIDLLRTDFQFHYVIGKGGFGKVWKVQKIASGQLYAMKEMSKVRIVHKRSIHSVINERKLLAQLHHPFLVNMHYAFQDKSNLYLCLDLLLGGDLRYHMSKRKFFTEEESRLEYLHLNGVLHRDIKPENLVLDESGYVRITDLGIARIWNPENSQDTSGTPGYMAPEVMCRHNHHIAVDYFAVGVIAYELMMNKRPYQGKSRKEIKDQMIAKQVTIKKSEVPHGWSCEAADFITKCLQRRPANRLGANGPAEIKQHIWFKEYDWKALLEKRLKAPFIPSGKSENFDPRVGNNNLSDADNPKDKVQLLKKEDVQNFFSGYYYSIDEDRTTKGTNNTINIALGKDD